MIGRRKLGNGTDAHVGLFASTCLAAGIGFQLKRLDALLHRTHATNAV